MRDPARRRGELPAGCAVPHARTRPRGTLRLGGQRALTPPRPFGSGAPGPGVAPWLRPGPARPVGGSLMSRGPLRKRRVRRNRCTAPIFQTAAQPGNFACFAIFHILTHFCIKKRVLWSSSDTHRPSRRGGRHHPPPGSSKGNYSENPPRRGSRSQTPGSSNPRSSPESLWPRKSPPRSPGVAFILYFLRRLLAPRGLLWPARHVGSGAGAPARSEPPSAGGTYVARGLSPIHRGGPRRPT